MNVGSLFSGIGGIDLGLEAAGMRVSWQCERDPWCRSILARHWPGVPIVYDIHAIDVAYQAGVIKRVDVLAGGFPCQPVSQAGKRLAQADERWLWPAFARAVRVLRPRYVIVENVPGLLARGMGDVLGNLAALGFDAEWTVFGARDVGAPHRRDRVWIVAWRPDADSDGLEGSAEHHQRPTGRQPAPLGDDADGLRLDVADADSIRLARPGSGRTTGERRPERQSWWATEPDVGRVAHGVPARVDRLRALGNAVVPQCAEWIGRRVMEMEHARSSCLREERGTTTPVQQPGYADAGR